MAGSDAIREFVIQGIISIFESVESDNWNSIKIEHQTDKDKVDIAFYNNGNAIPEREVYNGCKEKSRVKSEYYFNV